jgi:hypothetical protein
MVPKNIKDTFRPRRNTRNQRSGDFGRDGRLANRDKPYMVRRVRRTL